jgi:hypothetical protein
MVILVAVTSLHDLTFITVLRVQVWDCLLTI